MATRKIAPAIAAGCTMLVKPATQTPLTTLLLAGILQDVGLPPGVLNVFATRSPGPVVGALLEDSRIRKLSFTGSTEVGRQLLRQAAHTVMRTSMELGGNAALIVFDDADLEQAVAGTMVAKLRNGGESCTAAHRIFVQNGIARDFVDALQARLQAIRVGVGTDDVDVGPLIDAPARERVEGLIRDATERGARKIVGDAQLPARGHFIAPTLLDDVPADAAMLDQEIFGPVAPVIRFTDELEVVERANATPYGLVGYVYTRDLDRALRMSDRLDTGLVGINQGLVANAAAPFGGIKESGLGKEGGLEGIEEYLITKYVAVASAPVPRVLAG